MSEWKQQDYEIRWLHMYTDAGTDLSSFEDKVRSCHVPTDTPWRNWTVEKQNFRRPLLRTAELHLVFMSITTEFMTRCWWAGSPKTSSVYQKCSNHGSKPLVHRETMQTQHLKTTEPSLYSQNSVICLHQRIRLVSHTQMEILTEVHWTVFHIQSKIPPR